MIKAIKTEESTPSILKHLRDRSFKSLIIWKGLTCLAKQTEVFESIVLSTLPNPLSLTEFIEYAKQNRFFLKQENDILVLRFPKSLILKMKPKKSKSFLSRNFASLEENQEKLYKMILRIQNKLTTAIEINNKVRDELRLSQSSCSDSINNHLTT